MKKFYNFSIIATLFFLFASVTFAQTGVGKLSGVIIDTDTKEPLIGANLLIEGSNMGAATDINGEYFILNITPGTYTIRASYVGYAPKTIENVRVVAGITYELNIDLSTDFTLEDIVVIDRKFFEAKSTNTVKVLDGDQIAKLPVRGVTNVVALQSGVVVQDGSGGVDGNATINVRGGRGSEVLYIIDGVPQNNIFNNANRSQVSDNAIEQVSFQVGGYEAKYGQAQSGIVNVTTKSGQPNYSVFADVVTSQFLDDFGYNLYNLNLSGPIIPGNADHTIFLSGERGWFLDASPSNIERNFESIGKTTKINENNESGIWRFTGRTRHTFGDFRLNLGANINLRDYRLYIHSYAKNNSAFNPALEQRNYSFNGRLSQTVSANTFWNLNVGVKRDRATQMDPFFRDDLFAYGDSARFAEQFGITLVRPGDRGQIVPWATTSRTADQNNIFWLYGRVNNLYSNQENDALNVDVDLTHQLENHLIEIGGGFNYNIVRNYAVSPIALQSRTFANLTEREKFETLQPTVFGYDITGKTKSSSGDEFAPKEPIFAYAYVQDRFELEDLVLNVGLRMDYFDAKTEVLRDPSFPFGGGSDPNDFDPGDFKEKEVEVQFSPRIGIGFPVTESTVFHAQYGRFIQIPALTDLYASQFDLDQFISFDPQYVQDGTIVSEETTQYEVGFRQLLGNNAALNLTLFYKNIKGLVNRQLSFFQKVQNGELRTYIHPTNSDFGTTKGLAFSLDVTRISYFGLSLQYTFSIAEGTGSSRSSSQTAVFRNLDAQPPKVIAPLDFDQRHTGNITIDFTVPKGELGLLEMTSATTLISFASGRPYTPLDFFDILTGNNGGPSTIGYVNSRNAPGTFRVDLKVEKSFSLGNLLISPYLWVQNVFNSDNITGVYRSTGSPYTSGFLNTPDGQAAIQSAEIQQGTGEGYRQDYQALERNPGNFGIPRLIRLGLKVNFSNLGF